jgi:hypothetical protein
LISRISPRRRRSGNRPAAGTQGRGGDTPMIAENE